MLPKEYTDGKCKKNLRLAAPARIAFELLIAAEVWGFFFCVENAFSEGLPITALLLCTTILLTCQFHRTTADL